MNENENKNTRPEGMSDANLEQTPETAQTTSGDVGAQQAAGASEEATKAGASSKLMPLVIGAIVVALLMVAGAWYFMNDSGSTTDNTDTGADNVLQQGQQTAFEFEEGDPSEVVAVVNGTELTRGEFNETRSQIAQAAQQQGLTPDTEGAVDQINSQAIDTLVNTELILQAAAAAGISADSAAVDNRMEEIVSSVGGEEQLAQSLERLGLTEESLRADLEQEVLIEAYLETQLEEFTASEEEVANLYAEASAGQELPPLEEIRAQVEQQVVATKRQSAVNELIETLKSEATVDIRI